MPILRLFTAAMMLFAALLPAQVYELRDKGTDKFSVDNTTGDVSVTNIYGLTRELIAEGSAPTSATWTVATDFAINSGALKYTHSGGSGTATQSMRFLNLPPKASTSYILSYSVTAASGTAPVCTLTTAFVVSAAQALTETPVGSYSHTFTSAAAPTDIVISCTSSTTGSVTYDNISLVENPEVFNSTGLPDTNNWTGTGDFADPPAGTGVYTHSTGTGAMTQTTGENRIAVLGNRRYQFQYTINSSSGDVTCNLNTVTAAAVLLDVTPGTKTIFVTSAAVPGSTVITCTSTAGALALDNLSLKQVIKGRAVLAGPLSGGGDYGLAVDSSGNVRNEASFMLRPSVNVPSATALVLPEGNVFHVTGTTTVTSIASPACTAARNGRMITLVFDGALTFTEGNNLVMAGDFSTGATDAIQMVCDGYNFVEVARSNN